MSSYGEPRNGCVIDVLYRCTAFWDWQNCHYFKREPRIKEMVCHYICDVDCTCPAARAAAGRRENA